MNPKTITVQLINGAYSAVSDSDRAKLEVIGLQGDGRFLSYSLLASHAEECGYEVDVLPRWEE
jgi:hypothetical protein